MKRCILPSLILLCACDPASVKLSNGEGTLEEEQQNNDTETTNPDALEELVDSLEEDCQDGDEEACDELDEIQDLDGDCADGDEEACDALEELLEELQEDDNEEDWDEEDDDWSDGEWEADIYDAYFEFSLVIDEENMEEICSSIVEVEITSNGTITGGGSCTFEPPGGGGNQGEVEINISLDGSGEDESAYGEVTVIGPNGQPTASEFYGYCYEYQGTYGFYFEWYYTIVTPQGMEREHYGLVYY
jgi:hypothetical protein